METETEKTKDTSVTTNGEPVVPETLVDSSSVTTPTVETEKTDTVSASTQTATEILTSEPVLTTASAGLTQTLPLKQYVLAAGLVLVIGGILLYGLERQGRVDTNVFGALSTMIKGEPAAAIVNGTKISIAEYEKNRQQIITSAEQQGLDVTESTIQTEINTQAIDVLVNTELLRQSAKEAGINVTPDQVETRYQEVITSVGGEEELVKRMSELGLNEASLRLDIEGEILIQSYLDGAVDTSSIIIDDAQIQLVYDQAVAGAAGAELPPLADVREQIEAQIKFSQEQELVNAFIESLRTAAEIEILI